MAVYQQLTPNSVYKTTNQIHMLGNGMKYKILALALCLFASPSYAKPTDGEIYTYRAVYEYLKDIATPDELKNYPDAIKQAVEDALAGNPSRYSDEEFLLAMANIEQQRQHERIEKIAENRTKGTQFLAENAKKSGIITTKSGLQYKIIKQGTGKKPKPNSQVALHYQGWTIDGEEFDSSYGRSPFEVQLGKDLIQGFNEGLQYIGAGGEIELYIPDHLAYAEMGTSLFEGGETLIFKIKLLEVK